MKARKRPSTVVFIVCGAILCAALAETAHFLLTQAPQKQAASRALAEALDLTDLALFAQARYTRHLSQADLHSALQDGPSSFDLFPSGSIVAPNRNFPPAGFTDQEPQP